MAAAAAVAALPMFAGCSSDGHGTAAGRGRSGPTTTLIESDTWSLPTTSGGPSDTNFCTLLVSLYEHMAKLPFTANLHVREQFVADYVAATPTIEAAAPASLAPAAKEYLGTVAATLAALGKVGLNNRKLGPGSLGPSLLDPKFAAASQQVLAFSQQTCHYTIGT